MLAVVVLAVFTLIGVQRLGNIKALEGLVIISQFVLIKNISRSS